MYDLAGKVAVITGVERPGGIGRATALRFAREGVHAVLTDLGTGSERIAQDIQGVGPDVARVATEVEAVGAQVLAVPTDVSRPDAIALVEYPSRDHFLSMGGSPAFQALHMGREAGLSQTCIICSRPAVVNTAPPHA